MMEMSQFDVYDWQKLIDRGIAVEIGYSDYGGDLVDRANIEWIKRHWKEHRDYYCISTAYSGEMCFVMRNGHTREALDALQDYPLFDDEVYSEFEYNEVLDAMETFRYDHELRDTDRVNAALYAAMSENGRPLPTSWDYSDDDVMRAFRRYYREGGA